MTLQLGPLLTAIEANNEGALWNLIASLPLDDAVWAATTLGPKRIRSLLYRFVGQSRPTVLSGSPLPISTPGQSVAPEILLAEVLAEGFADRAFKGSARDLAIASAVRQQIKKLSGLRRAAPLGNFDRDVTRTLAVPTTCPLPLSDVEFGAAATRNGITVASIKAVAQVESGGRSGFDDQSRPKILFEAHHFRARTKRQFDLTHPHLSCDSEHAKGYYPWDQYNRLYEALILEPVAAIESCSWGKFQVMGFNHNGWPDALSFVRAMQESEANHLKAFEAYCQGANLIIHLKNKNWVGFAMGYNGKGYAKFSYDTKIEAAYKKYGGT